MRADEFCTEYETSKKPIRRIEDVLADWDSRLERRQHRDFAGNQTLLLYLLADELSGDGLLDEISPDLLAAFAARRGSSLDDYDEVRNYLQEMLARGDESVLGVVRQIKGQIGEIVFRDGAGGHAYLASSTNQEAWDVAIPHAHGVTEYIQVKIYSSAHDALSMMHEVARKVADGKIFDGEMPVNHIDFAVNEDIAEELRRLASTKSELAGIHIHAIPISEHEAAGLVWDGVANVGPEQLSNFFNQVFGGTLSAACLHAMSNAFLVYKNSKSISAAAMDAAISTALSAPGVVAANSTSLLLSKVALPMLSAHPVFAAVAAGMLARTVAKSWYDSREQVQNLLKNEAEHLELLGRALVYSQGY